VGYLPFLLKLATPVVVAYKLQVGTPFTVRGIAAYGLLIGGMLALFAGYELGVLEVSRTQYGHVYPGHVVEKLSSTGAEGTRHIGPNSGRNQIETQPVVTINGFHFYDSLGRLIVTGSPFAWVVEYRFACDAPHPCSGRDFVTQEVWNRLAPGAAINVRQADGETGTSRLDENPQWRFAAADLGLGAVLLFLAGLASGRISLFRRHEWWIVPAVVTAVEPVTYQDAVHTRVRFAYFDRNGDAQESADEVVGGAWKPGDECEAAFRTDQPGLATLRASHAP
jgi:hypothetical protein